MRTIAKAALPLLVAGSALAVGAKKDEPKKSPIDEVAERYQKARTPQRDKGQPAGVPVPLSPGECKSFAKDFLKAGKRTRLARQKRCSMPAWSMTTAA